MEGVGSYTLLLRVTEWLAVTAEGKGEEKHVSNNIKK